jgi:pimeloyl-ACP methyl ester carboxylesterase
VKGRWSGVQRFLPAVTKRRALVGTAAAVAVGVVGVAGFAANRALARRSEHRGAATAALMAAESGAEDELELPADVTHSYVEVRDGGRVHIVERGSGPVIVLLHGAGLAVTVWAYQFRDLADRYRLVAVDLRGHGESRSGSEGATIAAMADDVAEVLRSLDLRPALVVGHSMGGMTVLRLARRHPDLISERVSAVLLLSTASGVLPTIGPWNRLGPLAGKAAVAAGSLADRSGLRWLPEGDVGRRLARLGFGVAPSTAQVDAALKMMRSAQPSRLAGLVPELVAFDERAILEDLQIPVTVVVGDRDHLTPPALARELAENLGGARLVVWAGGGHMLMYERREALDWLIDRLASGREPPDADRAQFNEGTHVGESA